ncbi:hypothetical protein [Nocardia camponoti]|uniref:hypothetical protein n=1 Tax=Nocardia camponoti TaxID=1616106 RepID=UPI00166D70D4|nr:hypothetical protein [Nocardia camponoti]
MIAVGAAALGAVGWSAVAIANDVREPDDCLAVSPSIVNAIANQTASPATVLASAAVEDPFARSTNSTPHAEYYIVSLHLQTPTGETESAAWSVAAPAFDFKNGELAISAPLGSITPLTPSIEAARPTTLKALRCLPH